MTYRVIFTPRARADAVQAFRRMAEDSPTAAARWYVGLEKAIAKLSTMPARHPVAEEESERIGITLRQMFHGRRRNIWRIFFRSKTIASPSTTSGIACRTRSNLKIEDRPVR